MNLDIYTSEMAKSVWDKAFFMDKIPGTKCVIDFGCADGAMMRFLAPLFPDIMFVGYDIATDLIERARHTAPYNHNNIYFTSHKDVIQFVKDKYKSDEICINFSSVLHEVFSVTPGGREAISDMIRDLKPYYITIRDMYFSGQDRTLPFYYITEIVDELGIDKGFVEEFEDYYGSLSSTKNLVHFLMKYQWRNNGWTEELDENYFSWTIDQFISLVKGYGRIFETHYMLPYYTEKWKTIGLQPMDICTHAQFILRRWY